MHKIDIETWPRKEIFNFMSGLSNPFYTVSFNVDVTNLYNFTKQHNVSFYYSLVYLATKAINQVEAFHYSIMEDGVYYIDHRDPSLTDLKPGGELFHIVTKEMEDDLISFCVHTKEISLQQNCFLDFSKETNDLIYFSCIPWLETTAYSNEMDYTNPNFRNDSIPRISWGKYRNAHGKKIINISIAANHRLTDGYHIGQFGVNLEHLISGL